MEAIVNIGLKELEELKEELKRSKEETNRYKNQKEFNITFDCDIYDSKNRKRILDYRTLTYGNVDLLKQYDNWQEFQKIVKESFDKLVNESEILRFYNKFPKWIHKLFKC